MPSRDRSSCATEGVGLITQSLCRAAGCRATIASPPPLETKRLLTDQDSAKHAAARRRVVTAVNNWGGLGRWAFHVCRDPQMLLRELAHV